MIATTTPFTLTLPILAVVLVGAIPQHHQRDDPICVDQTTITITAPVATDPIPPSNSNEQEQELTGLPEKGANVVVTVTSTVTVVRTIDNAPEQSLDEAVTKTVMIFSTETSTVTVEAPLETKVSDLTTEPDESLSPGPAAPLPSIVQPHFGIEPVPYGNSSLPLNGSSSGLPHMSNLSKPSSTAAIASSSGYALPVSPGYENSIYFTNWSVALYFPILVEPQTEINQGNIWRGLSATSSSCLQDYSCILCVCFIWQRWESQFVGPVRRPAEALSHRLMERRG